jgi:hypothetical protein
MNSEPGSESGPDRAPRWLKSSYSYANGDCVEIADFPDGTIGVRHSKHPDGAVLRFRSPEWAAFTSGLKAGEFDLQEKRAEQAARRRLHAS